MPTPNTVIINRYLVERPIAGGAVWLALDLQTRARVALKAAPAGLSEQDFNRQAGRLYGLRHPNLPVVREYFADGGRGYVVMERVARGGDDERDGALAEAGPLPPAEARRWATRLLDALDYIHTLAPPLIHADIRPDNIRINQRGEPVLLGFGLGDARAYPPDDPFIAPELLGGAAADTRSDLFALAATLYQLLAGQPPLPAAARQSAVAQGQADPLRPPRRLNAQISAGLSEGLMRALALDPAERPAGAATLLDMIDYVPQLPPPPPARRIPRWPIALAAAAVLLLAVLALRGAFGGDPVAQQATAAPTMIPTAIASTQAPVALPTAIAPTQAPTAAAVPPTATPSIEPIAIAPTEAPAATAVPPTAVAATATALPPTAVAATATPVPATATQPIATSAPIEPSPTEAQPAQVERATIQGVVAQYSYTGRVATDSAGAFTKMRVNASVGSAPIGVLRNGDQVEIVQSNGTGWRQVRIRASADAALVDTLGWVEGWLVDGQNVPARFIGKVYSAPTDAAAQCGAAFDSAIYGSVEGLNGAGIPGARLRVRSSDGRNSFNRTTGKGGVYSVPGLGCTTWTVQLLSIPAAPKGFQANTVTVRNLNGGKLTAAEVRFKLQP